jgi:hypothetical protein
VQSAPGKADLPPVPQPAPVAAPGKADPSTVAQRFISELKLSQTPSILNQMLDSIRKPLGLQLSVPEPTPVPGVPPAFMGLTIINRKLREDAAIVVLPDASRTPVNTGRGVVNPVPAAREFSQAMVKAEAVKRAAAHGLVEYDNLRQAVEYARPSLSEAVEGVAGAPMRGGPAVVDMRTFPTAPDGYDNADAQAVQRDIVIATIGDQPKKPVFDSLSRAVTPKKPSVTKEFVDRVPSETTPLSRGINLASDGDKLSPGNIQGRGGAQPVGADPALNGVNVRANAGAEDGSSQAQNGSAQDLPKPALSRSWSTAVKEYFFGPPAPIKTSDLKPGDKIPNSPYIYLGENDAAPSDAVPAPGKPRFSEQSYGYGKDYALTLDGQRIATVNPVTGTIQVNSEARFDMPDEVGTIRFNSVAYKVEVKDGRVARVEYGKPSESLNTPTNTVIQPDKRRTEPDAPDTTNPKPPKAGAADDPTPQATPEIKPSWYKDPLAWLKNSLNRPGAPSNGAEPPLTSGRPSVGTTTVTTSAEEFKKIWKTWVWN